MTTSFMDKFNNKIHMKNCSIPNAEIKEIQQVLKLKLLYLFTQKI